MIKHRGIIYKNFSDLPILDQIMLAQRKIDFFDSRAKYYKELGKEKEFERDNKKANHYREKLKKALAKIDNKYKES